MLPILNLVFKESLLNYCCTNILEIVFGSEDIWSSTDLLLHINPLLIFNIRESSPIPITFPQIIIKHTSKSLMYCSWLALRAFELRIIFCLNRIFFSTQHKYNFVKVAYFTYTFLWVILLYGLDIKHPH